ncbi:MAG: hypothetical protein ACI90V_003017, partial [Bacillariaceae sp.]
DDNIYTVGRSTLNLLKNKCGCCMIMKMKYCNKNEENE